MQYNEDSTNYNVQHSAEPIAMRDFKGGENRDPTP